MIIGTLFSSIKLINSPTCPGLPTPCVSANTILVQFISEYTSTISFTTFGSTFPSNGHPKAKDANA
jgi:hypothetical protein